ncbi:MAG TPA: hypothetical protein VET27_01225, partial [Mycobacterium sp.]|nr:hypothetical protein [Mycobacterium sp.]
SRGKCVDLEIYLAAESVKAIEIFSDQLIVVAGAGSLMKKVVGISGGFGRCENRAGFAAQASLRVIWRVSSIASEVPKCTDAVVCHAMPEWRWMWLCSLKDPSRY